MGSQLFTRPRLCFFQKKHSGQIHVAANALPSIARIMLCLVENKDFPSTRK